jgi:hypothetical protein
MCLQENGNMYWQMSVWQNKLCNFKIFQEMLKIFMEYEVLAAKMYWGQITILHLQISAIVFSCLANI